jgi:hypothetical protein
VELVGPDGLLNQLTKWVPGTALEAEISEAQIVVGALM